MSKCNISGHGEHKRTAKVGKKKLGGNEKEKVVAQKEVLGDVLVSVTGESPKSLTIKCFECRRTDTSGRSNLGDPRRRSQGRDL